MRSRERRLFEVISRWHGEPLGYCTIASGQALSVDEAAGTALNIPAALFGGASEVVRVDEEGLSIHLPAGAELTFVMPDGQVATARGEGRAVRVEGLFAADVRLGALALELHRTDTPERIAALGPFNWREQRSTVVSAAVHLLVIALVAAVPPDGLALTTDHFDHPYRYVSTMTRALDKEIPEWLTKGMRSASGGKPGPGARGKMGDLKAPKRPRRYAVKGDASQSMPLGPVDVARMGPLAAIGASRYAALLLDPTKRALGADAERALGQIVAADPGQAYGVMGLNLDGTGRGGGCVDPDDCGTVGDGDSDFGRIGWGRNLGGDPGWRRGLPERKRTHTPGPPQVFAGHAKLKGALSKEIIRRVVRRHLNEVRYCYERELQRKQQLSGRVVVQFVITGEGRVGLSRVAQSTLEEAAVEQCVVAAVRRWQFPAPEGRGIVSVSYPFVFHAAGR